MLLTVIQATDDFEVIWDITDPALDGGISGSGLATYTIQVCTDSPTNCNTLVANPGPSGSFLYEGQSEHTYTFRVTATDHVDNTTTEEQTFDTASITKYYLFGGQRVAMRVGTGPQSAVYYLHGDHLGSVSMTTDATGTLVSQARYTPFGELNWEWGANGSPTDFGYTGQRADGFGLMDYNARFYAPSLGRFISPDSIIPGAGNPMAWDRFAYVQNNPIRLTDPTGHVCYDPGTDAAYSGNCDGGTSYKNHNWLCQKMPWECSTSHHTGDRFPKPPAMQPVADNPWDEVIPIQSSMPTGLTTPAFFVIYSAPPNPFAPPSNNTIMVIYAINPTREWYTQDYILPAADYDYPLFPLLTVGGSGSIGITTDGTGTYKSSEFGVDVAFGVPYLNVGYELGTDGSSLVADIGPFGVEIGEGGTSVSSPIGEMGFYANGTYYEVAIITSPASVHAAGGYKEYANRYVFPPGTNFYPRYSRQGNMNDVMNWHNSQHPTVPYYFGP